MRSNSRLPLCSSLPVRRVRCPQVTTTPDALLGTNRIVASSPGRTKLAPKSSRAQRTGFPCFWMICIRPHAGHRPDQHPEQRDQVARAGLVETADQLLQDRELIEVDPLFAGQSSLRTWLYRITTN